MSHLLGDPVPLFDERFPLPLDRPFTTVQASRAGIPANTLTRLVRDRLLRRLFKGVYVPAQVPDSLELRCQGLALVVPSGAVVTDRTAGWLHGAETLAPNDHLDVPPLSVFSRTGSRLRSDLLRSGERSFLPEDLVVLNGLLVTTPLRTALDLGRLLHRDQAIGALDSMLRTQQFSRDELLAGVERFRGFRGVVQLRALAPLADPRSESPGESTLRLRWLDITDLPRPTPQVPVLDPVRHSTYRLDLALEEIRFAAEYDGERFHSSAQAKARDQARRRWLSEDQGWTVRVFTRRDVYGPRQDVGSVLRDGIREARGELGRYRAPWRA